MTTTVWRAHLLHLTGSPNLAEAPDSLVSIPDGAVSVDTDGRIVACGEWNATRAPDARVIDRRGSFILPGFVDTHVHFPQVDVVDAWGGGTLLQWLQRHVFPAEARLADAAHARRCATDFVDGLLRAGTTCALIYGSQFEVAQAALFETIADRGLRAIVGRTTMVTGPDALTTDAEEAIRRCRAEIDRWHPSADEVDDALVHVALIPRFALSLDPHALRLLEKLWTEVADRGVRFSTHLSENDDPGGELDQVRSTFGVERYLDVYDGVVDHQRVGPGFLGRRSVFAHAVHCDNGEYDRLAETGSSIAHCPTSQLFLGSGTMPLARVRQARVKLGLGSDIAAGDTFSIPEVANAAFKVHMSSGGSAAPPPADLLHLATLGGAQALDLGDRIGNLDPGKEADFVVVDPDRYPPLRRRLEARCGDSPDDLLFALLLGMGRDTVATTVIRGRVTHDADLGAGSQ